MVQEPIFKLEESIVKMSDSIMSFKDCPNKCRDGYYVDPYQHKRIKCLYCENIRKKLAKDNVAVDGGSSIKKLLNLPDSFVGYGKMEFSTIIPQSQAKQMTDESLREMEKYLSGLLNEISVGTAPEESALINLGLNAYPCNFIYSYLMRAYINGASVAPYVTARDVFLMQKFETEGALNDYELNDGVVCKYSDLLKKDVCVVHITTGANFNYVRAVKGLMQIRAHYDKSTLVFTDAWWFNISNNQSEMYLQSSLKSLYDDDILSKAVARLHKITYKQKEVKKETTQEAVPKSVRPTNNIVGTTKQSFEALMQPKNSL